MYKILTVNVLLKCGLVTGYWMLEGGFGGAHRPSSMDHRLPFCQPPTVNWILDVGALPDTKPPRLVIQAGRRNGWVAEGLGWKRARQRVNKTKKPFNYEEFFEKIMATTYSPVSLLAGCTIPLVRRQAD